MKTRSRTYSIGSRMRTILMLFFVTATVGAAEMRSVEVDRAAGRYIMHSEVRFAASLEAVYSVFADYNLSTQFSGAIVESRNIAAVKGGQPGFYIRHRGCVLFFCKSFERYGTVELEPYKIIRASIDPERSDFHLSNESWRFKRDGDGTVVTYDLEFKPKFWVPPVIGPYVIKRKLRNDGGDAVDRIEAIAQDLRL